MFGVNFRKGYIVIQMVLRNDILTEVLKNVIALPRPFYVDSAVQFLCTEHANPTPFTGMGAKELLE